MGSIIFWAIVRTLILIPVLWYAAGFVDSGLWWVITAVAVYLVILHPAFTRYKHFREENQGVIYNTLCSNCEHFDESAVLCTMHDKHPTEEEIPCGGIDWQPRSE